MADLTSSVQVLGPESCFDLLLPSTGTPLSQQPAPLFSVSVKHLSSLFKQHCLSNAALKGRSQFGAELEARQAQREAKEEQNISDLPLLFPHPSRDLHTPTLQLQITAMQRVWKVVL